jgi:adenylate kinase family enzyme
MRRVAVVGSSGAGKSTFARRLGERTGLPVIHLDHHFWRPGWDPTPDDEWDRVVTELAAGDAWIIDGNYSRTMDVRARAADTVVFLDYSRAGCLARALRRNVTNYGRAVQAPGCPERFDFAFLKWIATYPNAGRQRMLEKLEAAPPGLAVHMFRRPRDANRFLATLP